jgi:hypothetical protein
MKSALILSLVTVAMVSQQQAPSPPIVVGDLAPFNGNRFSGSPNGTFGGMLAIYCAPAAGQQMSSIAGALGSNLKSLTIRAYHPQRFASERAVIDHVRTMLVARPENGTLGRLDWSEVTDLDIAIVSEWNDGRFGRLDLGSNGPTRYAHLQDHRGCEWWARYQSGK